MYLYAKQTHGKSIRYTWWRAAAETTVIDVFDVQSDEPGSQGYILISIFVQNMPEMSPSNHHGQWLASLIYIRKRKTERKNRGIFE